MCTGANRAMEGVALVVKVARVRPRDGDLVRRGEVLSPAEVVAFTEVHNRRSRAVMERLGMHLCSEIRWRGLIEGKPGVHDEAPFAPYALSSR